MRLVDINQFKRKLKNLQKMCEGVDSPEHLYFRTQLDMLACSNHFATIVLIG